LSASELNNSLVTSNSHIEFFHPPKSKYCVSNISSASGQFQEI
jgi:hypothetical protein